MNAPRCNASAAGERRPVHYRPRPGVNSIVVAARDTPDTTTRRVVVVRRDGPDGSIMKTPKSDDPIDDWLSDRADDE